MNTIRLFVALIFDQIIQGRASPRLTKMSTFPRQLQLLVVVMRSKVMIHRR